MDKEVEKFIHEKLISGMEQLHDYLEVHPQSTVDEAEEELFQILMGKRIQ